MIKRRKNPSWWSWCVMFLSAISKGALDKLCREGGGAEIYAHNGWVAEWWMAVSKCSLAFLGLNVNVNSEMMCISCSQRLPLARKSFWESILKAVFNTSVFTGWCWLCGCKWEVSRGSSSTGLAEVMPRSVQPEGWSWIRQERNECAMGGERLVI